MSDTHQITMCTHACCVRFQFTGTEQDGKSAQSVAAEFSLETHMHVIGLQWKS